jgi:hypothetical protein
MELHYPASLKCDLIYAAALRVMAQNSANSALKVSSSGIEFQSLSSQLQSVIKNFTQQDCSSS